MLCDMQNRASSSVGSEAVNIKSETVFAKSITDLSHLKFSFINREYPIMSLDVSKIGLFSESNSIDENFRL